MAVSSATVAASRRGLELRRRMARSGWRVKPSLRIASPWFDVTKQTQYVTASDTRVTTWTSAPASLAARATGRRWEQKYQSSVVKKRIRVPGFIDEGTWLRLRCISSEP